MALNPLDNYWIVATNASQRWAGARGIYVATSDADYIAWDAIDGNDATNIDTETNLWGVISAIALSVYLAGQGHGLVAYSSGISFALSNPLLDYIEITMTAPGLIVTMPQANLPISRPLGKVSRIKNTGANSFALNRFTGTGFAVVGPGEFCDVETTTFASTSGSLHSAIGTFNRSGLLIGLDGLSVQTGTLLYTDGSFAGESDTVVPSQKAVKTYANSLVLTAGGLLAANNLSDVASAATSRTNLGLGNVDNTSDANKPVSTAQATADALAIPKSLITARGDIIVRNATVPVRLPLGAVGTALFSDGSDAGWRAPVKGDVGLGNVDNTSDVNKPVSAAQATADALAIPKSLLTTRGDLIVRNTTVPARLSVGATGTFLYSDGLDPIWRLPVKADVGLGNVDNTSDVTKFTNTVLAGIPTANTASPGTNTTQLSTTAFVKAAIDVVLGGVAAAFDTLSEIATALGLKLDKAGTTTNDSAVAGNIGEFIQTGSQASNATATVTITIASPGVVTWTGHGLTVGPCTTVVQFTTTGALPTGLTAATPYYAKAIDANTFNLATSAANALAGTFINTSGTQSGVHTGLPYVPLSSAVERDVAAMLLPAGDYEARGNVSNVYGATTTVTYTAAGFSLVSGTRDRTFGRRSAIVFGNFTPGNSDLGLFPVGPTRFSLATPTTVFLYADCQFGVNTVNAGGWMRVRRIR